MHYVYYIKSTKTNFNYVGTTSNLDKRLELHNNRKVFSTQKHAPFTLVYYEAYLDEKDAKVREYKLKHHGSSIGHLKNRIQQSLTRT